MIHIKKLILMFALALFVATPVFGIVGTQNASAQAAAPVTGKDCEKNFLGIHPWFRGLSVVVDTKCVVAGPGQTLDNGTTLDLTGYIWRIVLNVIDIVLALIGYVAFFFILYGGFQFLVGGSNPGQIEKARKTILNASIGLVIALGAVAVVNLIFRILG